MNLPEFNDDGDLPPGVHPATLTEAIAHFGYGSPQRQIVAGRLVRIYSLAESTGHLARFAIFGSFVTTKMNPRDVDLVIIMKNTFDVNAVSGDVAAVFRHADADAQLGASIFWSTEAGAFGGAQAMIEFWQIRRDGGRRGLVEIVPEQP